MHKVTINQVSIAYEDIGNGEPILFIHPPGMGRKVFYEQKPLSKHFRLIIPDLVGHGDSSYDGSSEITIKRFTEDLIELMDHLQLSSAVILGYSAGGSIAQYMSFKYPSRVKALILLGGFPIVDNFSLTSEHLLGMYVVKKSKKFLSNVLSISHTKDQNYRKILKEHMYKSDKNVWLKFYFESFRFNCKKEVLEINAPVLLLYGSKSNAINTNIKFYKRALFKKEIYVIKGAPHQLPTLAATQVNQIITGYLLILEVNP